MTGTFWKDLPAIKRLEPPQGWGLGNKYEALIHAEDMALFPNVKSRFDFTGEIVSIEWSEECFWFEYRVLLPYALYGVTFRDNLCACCCPDDAAIFERFVGMMECMDLALEPFTHFSKMNLKPFIGRKFNGTLYPQEDGR